MTTNPAPAAELGAEEPAGRPRTVDLALYAILLRCLFAVAAAFALFGAKPELRRNAAILHPDWSAATLVSRVDSELRSNLVVTFVYVALVLLIAKFIRDGRNWAPWSRFWSRAMSCGSPASSPARTCRSGCCPG